MAGLQRPTRRLVPTRGPRTAGNPAEPGRALVPKTRRACLKLGFGILEARKARPFAPGFNSPSAVSRAATPLRQRQSGCLLCDLLSFDAGVRAAVFFDLDDVLALVIFLAFGLTIVV